MTTTEETRVIDLSEVTPPDVELRILRRQVKELQERGTQLELENRRYKRLYRAARNLLEYILLDSSIAARLHASGDKAVTEEGIARTVLAGTDVVFRRIEQLENDASVQAAFYVRQMIDKAENLPFNLDSYGNFVWMWVNHFKHLLGIPFDGDGKKDPG